VDEKHPRWRKRPLVFEQLGATISRPGFYGNALMTAHWVLERSVLSGNPNPMHSGVVIHADGYYIAYSI